VRPLPLLALLFCAAPDTRAQTRVGAVEAGGVNTGAPGGSLSSALPGGGAPQLVTLQLTAPSLGLTPSALVPTPVLAAAPFAPIAALPASVIAPAVARPAALPASAAGAAAARALLGAAPQDLEKTPVEDLIEHTKRLFGESSQPGYKSAEYLKPGAPFQFGESEVFRYRSALIVPGAKSGAGELKALVAAAEGLAKSAGIVVERGERAGGEGGVVPVMKIVPLRDGHRLNRLAYDLGRSFDSTIEYAPDRTDGGVAAYNSTKRVLFLPDFGRDDSFEAILHESRHAAFTKRLRRGDFSVFHASLVAYPGRKIAPNASSYVDYMSFEEISTHAKTLLHDILRALRAGDAKAVSDARADAYQFTDVLRSAEVNLFQLQRLSGLKSYRLTGESWPVVPGGHWEAVNLPNAIMVVPILDGQAATKRGLWSRLLQDDPEPPAVLLARRQGEFLRPLIKALTPELEALLAALGGAEPDLKRARAAAVRMVSLADEADKRFGAR